VRGCTFYNNSAYRGGAIYRSGGPVNLTGNLFFGNTASNNAHVFYTTADRTIVTISYNISDKADGTAATNSGYTGGTGDLFNVTDITFATGTDPTTKPSSSTSLKTLTTLPGDFPALYFDGTPRTEPATAGAVSSD
jgi:hypothetical protein